MPCISTTTGLQSAAVRIPTLAENRAIRAARRARVLALAGSMSQSMIAWHAGITQQAVSAILKKHRPQQ
jgi:DNA-binding transcriptional regulator LsrR (DeoR family)